MRVGKQFTFVAVHQLPNYEGECCEPHTHNWRVEIEVEGEIHVGTCMVIDFKRFEEIVQPVIDLLNHSNLNNVIANPTAEALAYWIAGSVQSELAREGVDLSSVTVWESDISWAKIELPPAPRLRFPKPGEFPI